MSTRLRPGAATPGCLPGLPPLLATALADRENVFDLAIAWRASQPGCARGVQR